MLDEILIWKEERNRLIHALLKQELAHNEVLEIAQRGNDLAEKIRNRSRNYSRAVERKTSKDRLKKD